MGALPTLLPQLTLEPNFLGKPINFGNPNRYSFIITDSTMTNINMPVSVIDTIL
jgi:hypothetical protein